VITDTEASPAIAPSVVQHEDGIVKESETSASHVTAQGSEQAVPSTIGATSEATKAVSSPSFPSFPMSLQNKYIDLNRPKMSHLNPQRQSSMLLVRAYLAT
jgi:hypothetical protein